MNTSPPRALRLKGGSLSVTVLELVHADAAALERELAAAVAQAPQLLQHAPVLLALERLGEHEGTLDLAALLALCRRHSLQPVGVRAARAQDLAAAERLGLAVLPAGRGRERAPEPRPAARTSRVVSQPVRGGQQIYAEGDLILLAPVSAGAEVMATGHIHAYAPLRGRALAGVQGDTSARLFCRELQAELVAVAGHYRIADDLRREALWQRSAQVLLHEGELQLAPL